MSCCVLLCFVLYCYVLESLQTQISSLNCPVVCFCLMFYSIRFCIPRHSMTMFQSGSWVADSGDGSEPNGVLMRLVLYCFAKLCGELFSLNVFRIL